MELRARLRTLTLPGLTPSARLLIAGAAVSTAATAAVLILGRGELASVTTSRWIVVGTVAALSAAGSVRPLLLFRDDESEAFSCSEAFLTVLLLDVPSLAAVGAMAAASTAAQLAKRRAPSKAVFNVGQIAAASGAAAAVDRLVIAAVGGPAGRLGGATLGALAFSGVNTAAVASILVAMGASWRSCLVDGLRIRLVLAFAGIVVGAASGVAVGEHAWALALVVPSLVLLRAAVAAQFAAEHDRARVRALLDATLSTTRSLRREQVADRVLRSARLLLRTPEVRLSYVEPTSGLVSSVTAGKERMWLVASGRRRDEPFEASDQGFLDALGALASASITNAGLYHQVKLERQRLASIALSIGEAVIAVDLDGRITFANTAASRMVALPGVTTIVDDHLDGDALLAPAFVAAPALLCIEDGTVVRDDEAIFPARDGRPLPVSYVASPVMQDGTAVGAVITFRDRSDVKAMEEELRYRAYHDGLTGLASRRRLMERLEVLLAGGLPSEGHALMFVDVDRFKAVNDALGHAAGDELLLVIAERLRNAVPEGATVARFGGDEFVILLEGAGDAGSALALAQRLAAVSGVVATLADGSELTPSVSIGVALAEPGDSPDDVLHNADVAMNRARARGHGGGIEIFDRGSMAPRSSVRLHLEADLRRAVEGVDLGVLYLPRWSLDEVRVVAAEVVPVWRHPLLGTLGPERFLPLAEESGLSVAIGRTVLEQAARFHRRLSDAGLAVPLTVGLTPRQFHEAGLVIEMRRLLRASGMDPGALTVEITESMVADGLAGGLDVMAQLRALGAGIAVADFGTGNSSLGYLKQFPVQEIKVDGSFVAGIDREAIDRSIVRAVVQLAEALGARPVAEGLDTDGHVRAARALGCRIGQGAALGPPETPDGFFEMLRKSPGGAFSAHPRESGSTVR